MGNALTERSVVRMNPHQRIYDNAVLVAEARDEATLHVASDRTPSSRLTDNSWGADGHDYHSRNERLVTSNYWE
jgi:hypothetical protein